MRSYVASSRNLQNRTRRNVFVPHTYTLFWQVRRGEITDFNQVETGSRPPSPPARLAYPSRHAIAPSHCPLISPPGHLVMSIFTPEWSLCAGPCTTTTLFAAAAASAGAVCLLSQGHIRAIRGQGYICHFMDRMGLRVVGVEDDVVWGRGWR